MKENNYEQDESKGYIKKEYNDYCPCCGNIVLYNSNQG